MKSPKRSYRRRGHEKTRGLKVSKAAALIVLSFDHLLSCGSTAIWTKYILSAGVGL